MLIPLKQTLADHPQYKKERTDIMLPIMDVSRWQGDIDWDKVKASGLVSGAMLRTRRTLRKYKNRSLNGPKQYAGVAAL